MTGGSSSFSLPPVKLRAISRSFLCIRTMPRRFRPSWSVEEQEACFVVRDHDGQQLACAYFEDEPGRRSAAKLLTKDETRQIVATFLTTVQYMGYRRRPVSCNRAGSRSVCSILHQRDLCRARSFPLEPSSPGGIHSMFVVARRNLVAHRNLAGDRNLVGHRNLVGRRTLVASDNNIALAQAPLRRLPQWSKLPKRLPSLFA